MRHLAQATVTAPYYRDDLVTLYHGDCIDLVAWLAADVLVTDPPYGSEGLSNGYGRSVKTIANDRDTAVRDRALAMWGGRPVLCFGTPKLPEPPGEWKERLVWDKREPGLGAGAWRYNHETIFVRGEGWTRADTRSFSVISVPSGNGTPEKAQHVHAKPVALMARLLLSAPPGVIADPFAGIGATMVAAKRLGRPVIGVELEERYCEIAARRLDQGVLDFGTPA